MKFEKLIVKTPDKEGVLISVHDYITGTINFRTHGVFVYWGGGNVDVYSGTYCFEIEPKEVKK